jgi:hypothetical protein
MNPIAPDRDALLKVGKDPALQKTKADGGQQGH